MAMTSGAADSPKESMMGIIDAPATADNSAVRQSGDTALRNSKETVIARSENDEAIHALHEEVWIASLRSQ
jgi:hypothetical protein